jgi:stearoyl-CoA desaturase (delta-9 desaturase)
MSPAPETISPRPLSTRGAAPSTRGAALATRGAASTTRGAPLPVVEFGDPVGRRISNVIYWGIHVSCLLAFVTPVTTAALVLCAGMFWLRMFGITGAYHRYFSHRTYKTSRVFQFVLAWIGASAVQKGPLWWAATHRVHHRNSDAPGDPHSPREGFWHAHQGWIFGGAWDDTRTELIRDFARYPELVWLNKFHFVPPIVSAIACWLIAGFPGLLWGMAISTLLVWHATYSINSLAHRIGKARYDTGDDSKNSWILALLTLGEGWHNNHHFHQSSTRQGFYWWEIDITYYVLRALALVGLVWDIKEPPARVYAPRGSEEKKTAPLREAA